MDRIHISNNDGKAFFGVSGNKQGKQGDVKTATFFGQTITVLGTDEYGAERRVKFNKGSLIDFLNTELEKRGEKLLDKGWFIHDSDANVTTAYYKIFNKTLTKQKSSGLQPTTTIEIAKPEQTIVNQENNKPTTTIVKNETIENKPVQENNNTTTATTTVKNEIIQPEIKQEKKNNNSTTKTTTTLVQPKPVVDDKPLSFTAVMKKAKEEFADDERKNQIVAKIKAKLENIRYAKVIAKDQTFKLPRQTVQRGPLMEEDIRVIQFLYSLPGIDRT